MSYIYSGCVPSEISSVCSKTKTVVSELSKHTDLNEEEIQNLRLILSELMINSCDHGNGNDSNKLISLTIKVDEESISLIVKDEGRGIKWSKDLACRRNLSASGRGLRIVCALTDDFTIKESEVMCRIIRKK